MNEEIMKFDIPFNNSSIIKVIGVGGGGGNAVDYMYGQGIKDVSFVVCNTDAQALRNSPVPVKIQLGESLTEGRGAGNKPNKGRESAIENIEDVIRVLEDNTKMVFVTAGMGGGTGTGAAPVIAKAAKDLGILTVGIVTIPFRFEGKLRINQALDGIMEMEKHVDSLLIINNEKLREMFGDLRLTNAFSKADDVLTIAARGIAELITKHGKINVDFADVETVMKDSGVAVMGSAFAEGETRAIDAIQAALESPLLNNNDIVGAKNVLLNITSGEDEITMDELSVITEFVQGMVGDNANVIWGTATDVSLGNQICVTIVATGFVSSQLLEHSKRNQPKITRVSLDGEEEFTPQYERKKDIDPDMDEPTREIDFGELEFDKEARINKYYNPIVPTRKTEVEHFNPTLSDLESDLSSSATSYYKLKINQEVLDDERSIEQMENIPAYKRKNMMVNQKEAKVESYPKQVSRFSLSDDPRKGGPRISKDNPYLHDNVD